MLIRKEGLPFIAALTGISLLLRRTPLNVLAWAPTAFVTWFFRDPVRVVPSGKGLVLSPADGRVMEVRRTQEQRVGPCTKVSIFMSVFNVHVNRAPIGGEVLDKEHRPGTFHMANLGKKTEANERMLLYLSTDYGVIRVDQVAGMIARRISCWPVKGQRVSRGERIGLIRFGSLVELYVPEWVNVLSQRGDRVFAGQTVLGRVQK